MPTQRPFLPNFLAAFRAHPTSLPSKSSPSAASTAAATIWTSAATASSKPTSTSTTSSPANITASTSTEPRPIPSQKANPYTTTSSSLSTSASDRQLSHTVSPNTHLPVAPKPTSSAPAYPTCQEVGRAARRGSESSEGSRFRDANTAAWYIGGRTAGGEEKYYKLSMVKRDRSEDRISADRLSL